MQTYCIYPTLPLKLTRILMLQEKMQFEFHNAISQDDRLVELLKASVRVDVVWLALPNFNPNICSATKA